MAEVAKKAGVSITTASFVLNGRTEEMRIAPNTAQKVMQVVQELGYIPNVSAKKLTNGSGETFVPEIAVMWAPKVGSAFLELLVRNTMDLVERGQAMEMRLTVSPFRISQLETTGADILSRSYNGAIASPYFEEEYQYIQRIAAKIPIVVLHRPTELCPSVAVDNYDCGALAARVFAMRGHRRVAILCADRVGTDIRQTDHRLTGFRDVCQEKGMECQAMFNPYRERKALTTAELSAFGRQMALDYLSRDALPDAIFIQSDVIAAGFLNSLQVEGVRVPEDIEIITYGDDRVAAACYPGITTVDYPSEAIARHAIQMMSDMLLNPFSRPASVSVKTRVTFRRSCPMPEGWIDEPVG